MWWLKIILGIQNFNIQVVTTFRSTISYIYAVDWDKHDG